jgi:hypothetical protein
VGIASPSTEPWQLPEQQQAEDGHLPAGPATLLYGNSADGYYLWTGRAREVCWGHAGGLLGTESSCATADELPNGRTPAIAKVYFGSVAGDQNSEVWMTVLLADLEDVKGLVCSGMHLVARKVVEVPVARGTRSFYVLLAPWLMYGTVDLVLLRQGATVVEPLNLGSQAGDDKVGYTFRCTGIA